MNEEPEPNWETIFEELREEVLELEGSDDFKEEEEEATTDNFDFDEPEEDFDE